MSTVLSTTTASGDIFGQSWENATNAAMLSAKNKQALKDATAAVAALMNTHTARSNAIKGDGDLSEAGRKSKLAALVVRSDGQLATVTGATVNELEAETQELTQALASASSMVPTVQETLLIIERRAIAATFDPLEIESKLLALAQNGTDDLSVIAIITAPALAPLARPEVCARARGLMGARSLPDKAEQLRQARESLVILNNAVSTATHGFANKHERAFFGIDAISRDAVPAKDAPQA